MIDPRTPAATPAPHRPLTADERARLAMAYHQTPPSAWPPGHGRWAELLHRALGDLAAAEAERDRLREWKAAILEVLNANGYGAMEWAGDKDGWGAAFEYIAWAFREIDRLKAGRFTNEELDAQLDAADPMPLSEGEVAAIMGKVKAADLAAEVDRLRSALRGMVVACGECDGTGCPYCAGRQACSHAACSPCPVCADARRLLEGRTDAVD